MVNAPERVHIAQPFNPHRVACGKSIWSVSFVVRRLESVTCIRCKYRMARFERMAADNRRAGLDGVKP